MAAEPASRGRRSPQPDHFTTLRCGANVIQTEYAYCAADVAAEFTREKSRVLRAKFFSLPDACAGSVVFIVRAARISHPCHVGDTAFLKNARQSTLRQGKIATWAIDKPRNHTRKQTGMSFGVLFEHFPHARGVKGVRS
jgi:hypothetical protein